MGIFLIEAQILIQEIIGKEKTTRTIETVLASPISLLTLLRGKVLVMYLPPLFAVFLSSLFYVGAANLIATGDLFAYIPEPVIWINFFLVATVLGFVIVEIVNMVSLITDAKVTNVVMFLAAFLTIFCPAYLWKRCPLLQ